MHKREANQVNDFLHYDDSFHTVDGGIPRMQDVDTIESLGFEDIDIELGRAGNTYKQQVAEYRRSRRGSPVLERVTQGDAEDIIHRGLFNLDFDPVGV